MSFEVEATEKVVGLSVLVMVGVELGFSDGVGKNVEVSVEVGVSAEVSESENSVRKFRVAGWILLTSG